MTTAPYALLNGRLRFGRNVNVHLHCLMLDRVYRSSASTGRSPCTPSCVRRSCRRRSRTPVKLLDRITAKNVHGEESFGKPVGKEIL